MKFENIVKIALVSVVIYILLTVGFCAIATNAIAETYPMTTVVVSLDYDVDTVIVEDFNGNLWEIEGCEDWQLFDICSMIMDDNNTSIIYDDTIITYRYDGWIECV